MAAICALAFLYSGACYALWTRKIDVHAEGGPIEIVQWIGWFVAAIISAAAIVRAKVWRDRASSIWLFAIAMLAAARELDLHEAIQHGVSWLPPIHFRIDWLLDPAVPLWPKVFWLTVFGVTGAALLIPPLVTKAPGLTFLKRGDAPTWLLIVSFILLGMGYASDDIIGRGRIGIHYEVTQGMEEIFELLGALIYGMGAWYELRAPLTTRIVALGPVSDIPTTVVVPQTPLLERIQSPEHGVAGR
jgi:hypothetical protein